MVLEQENEMSLFHFKKKNCNSIDSEGVESVPSIHDIEKSPVNDTTDQAHTENVTGKSLWP